MATIQLYDHTVGRFITGQDSIYNDHRLMLCSSAVFDATNTSIDSVAKTEIYAPDYPNGGILLSNVVIGTSATNDGKFGADDVIINVTTGTLEAAYGIIYSLYYSNTYLVAFLDFGANISVNAPNAFSILWNASGIIQFTYA